jgi:hypothetical protein
MDVVTTVLSWAVTVACVYLSYVAVRETEQIVRRSFSLVLTLVLVVTGSGLLIGGLSPVTSTLLDPNLYGELNYRWTALIAALLLIGAVALVWRDAARRLQRGTCAQCNTPLLGHVACPSCGWGGLGLLGSAMGLVRHASSRMPAAVQARPATPTGAPTVVGMAPPSPPPSTPAPGASAAPAPPAAATQQAQFCPQCGTSLAAGQSFCPRCGASTT